MTFWYMYFVWAYNVIHKVCSSIMNKYNFLRIVHTNPTQQGFRLLRLQVSKYSWKQMRFWDRLCWKPRSEPAAVVLSHPMVTFEESKEPNFLEEWNNLVSSYHYCLTKKVISAPVGVYVISVASVQKNSALLHAWNIDFCQSSSNVQAQLGSIG